MNKKNSEEEILNTEQKIKLLNESLEEDLKQLKKLENKIVENKKTSKEIFIMTTLIGLGIVHIISKVFAKTYMINTIFGPMTSIQFDYITIMPGVLVFSGFLSIISTSERRQIKKQIKSLTTKIDSLEKEKLENEQQLRTIKNKYKEQINKQQKSTKIKQTITLNDNNIHHMT